MRFLCRNKFVLFFFFLASLSGCRDRLPGSAKEMTAPVEIRVNQSGVDLVKKYPDQFEITKYPQGIQFYAADWGSVPNGSVVLATSAHTVTLPYILSATGNDDPNFASENIIHWNINAGITEADVIAHDDARKRFFGLLQSLRNAGWVRAIRLSEPRLKDKQALDYRQKENPIYSLDPDYVLSLEQWMTLDTRATWSLYSDHAYLDVSITRDPSKTAVTKPGAYFVEYALKSDNEKWRSVVGPTKRLHWKTELPAVLAQLAKSRQAAEETLKKENITIDEAYRDPPLPDLSH